MEDLTEVDKQQVRRVNAILKALTLPHGVKPFTEADMLQIKADVRALRAKKARRSA